MKIEESEHPAMTYLSSGPKQHLLNSWLLKYTLLSNDLSNLFIRKSTHFTENPSAEDANR